VCLTVFKFFGPIKKCLMNVRSFDYYIYYFLISLSGEISCRVFLLLSFQTGTMRLFGAILSWICEKLGRACPAERQAWILLVSLQRKSIEGFLFCFQCEQR
jgi:hypothetical protein